MNAPPVPNIPPVVDEIRATRTAKKHYGLKFMITLFCALIPTAVVVMPYLAKVMVDLGLKADDLPAPTMRYISVANAIFHLLGDPSYALYCIVCSVFILGFCTGLWVILIKTRASKTSLLIAVFLLFIFCVGSWIPNAMPFIKIRQSLSTNASDDKE